MMRWLLPAKSRLLAALTALAAVSGCAMAPAENGAAAPVAGWRVVERVGEARFSPPEAGTWLAVITGRPIAEGSEVTTGPGGRLILAVPDRHISVGPGSRFFLPRTESGDRLEQRAGWLRYRMASAVGQPFRIHTRSLDLEFAAAVVDVRVEQGSTEVTVMEGEVRLATPDGLRRTEIAAGQSARSSGLGGAQLAIRRGPAETLESIEPLIVPAVHPTPSPPAGRAPPLARDRLQGATINPAQKSPEAHEIAPARRRAERAPAPSPGGLTSGPGDRSARAVAAPPVPESSEAAWFGGTDEPSTGRRRQFERLTEGMVDDVPPAGLRDPAR